MCVKFTIVGRLYRVHLFFTLIVLSAGKEGSLKGDRSLRILSQYVNNLRAITNICTNCRKSGTELRANL